MKSKLTMTFKLSEQDISHAELRQKQMSKTQKYTILLPVSFSSSHPRQVPIPIFNMNLQTLKFVGDIMSLRLCQLAVLLYETRSQSDKFEWLSLIMIEVRSHVVDAYHWSRAETCSEACGFGCNVITQVHPECIKTSGKYTSFPQRWPFITFTTRLGLYYYRTGFLLLEKKIFFPVSTHLHTSFTKCYSANLRGSLSSVSR